MKRTTLFWMVFPLGVAAAGAAATMSCRGGVDGYGDAGTDGDIIGSIGKGTSSGASDGGGGDDGGCATAIVTVDDSAATDNASSGGPGCTNDDECTVRLAGDYCACPGTPRPMLVSRATAFDEGLTGITQKCTCLIPPCVPPAPSKAACRDGRCVLVDAGE